MRNGELEKKMPEVRPMDVHRSNRSKRHIVVGRLQSASRSPIIVRRQGRIEPVAIALHADPDPSTLRLRSRTAVEKPLVGYEVFAQKPAMKLLPQSVSPTSLDKSRSRPAKLPCSFY